MTNQDIYNNFIKQFNDKIEKFKNEIEECSKKHSGECNNYSHLFWTVRENMSEDYYEFISAYRMNVGIEGLKGTDLNYKLSLYINNSIINLLSYHEKYAKTLYDE